MRWFRAALLLCGLIAFGVTVASLSGFMPRVLGGYILYGLGSAALFGCAVKEAWKYGSGDTP